MFPELFRDDVFRLETRRLWLRWPRAGDAPAIAALAGDRDVAEMTARIPHPYPAEQADAFVVRARGAMLAGSELVFAVAPKARPNALVGMVGIHPTAQGPALGYWIGKEHWGQGYAREAARALIDAAFTYTELPEIVASARVVNHGSRRVLETCGFRAAGGGFDDSPLRGRMAVDRFVLDRRAWASLKSWGREGWAPTAPASTEEHAEADGESEPRARTHDRLPAAAE